MQNEEDVKDKKLEQLFNVAVMAAGSWLIWYYSGPIAAEAGRNTYEFIYDKLWGTPNWFSWRMFERAFYYIPNRSHIGNLLYNYAEYAGPLIAAPFLYKLPDVIRDRFKKRVKNMDHLANKDEDIQVAALSDVVSQLRNATLKDEESQSSVVYTPAREARTTKGQDGNYVYFEPSLGPRSLCLRFSSQ